MQHLRSNRKFGRTNKQRAALLKGLLVNLIQEERIITTLAKAKSLRPLVEKLVTHGKQATLAKRRLLVARTNATIAKKLCEVLGPRYQERAGGYTRIVKLAPRQSDAAPRAVIEFIK